MKLNIAFDLDGTIGSHPFEFSTLMFALNGEVFHRIVLTAAAGEFPPEKRPDEVCRRLAGIGIHKHLHYDELYCCESFDKGAICQARNIHIIIDDDQKVIDDVKAKSRSTLRLKVAVS